MLEGVGTDDPGLHGCRIENEPLQAPDGPSGLLAGLEEAHRLLVPGGIGEEEGLQELGLAGTEVPVRQGFQHLGAQEGKLRLHNHAQHVFVSIQVHAGLAAKGRIHLGEKRCRDIGVADSALVDAGRESGQVRGDASADGEHQRLSRSARLQQ